MANVLNRNTLEFLRSVNTPDYDPEDWIINPDISNVENVPHRYWKLEGETPVKMSEAEKQAVDDTIVENMITSKRVSVGDTFEVLFADDRNNIQNRWLGLTGNNNIFSNETPAIVGWKSKLVSVDWSNNNDVVDFELQIHGGITGNSNLKYSSRIQSKIAYIQNIEENVIFEAGEQLAAYVKRINNNRPRRAVLKLIFVVLDASVENFDSNAVVNFRPA